MPQSLVQIYLHIVFSTKNRRPFLRDTSLRDMMYAYLAGICQNQRSPAICVGGFIDHVHILCRLAKTITPSGLIAELKRGSSKWIKNESNRMSDFYWQRGYGAFSISPSHLPDVTAYITNQEEHHRHVSFQDEFRRLCRKYRVDMDERYAWD